MNLIIFVFNFFGQIAQLVEQWTENPCVGGSIPSLPTIKAVICKRGFFYFKSVIIFINFNITIPLNYSH